MAKLRLGSDENKKLFCGEFIDTFHPFEVRDLKWPELSEANLQRVRSMPFWSEAVTTERTAGLRVKLMADAETDPVIREAIALQAYEESRHAQMLEALLQAYGMDVPEGGGEKPRDIEWGFIRMGYGEELAPDFYPNEMISNDFTRPKVDGGFTAHYNRPGSPYGTTRGKESSQSRSGPELSKRPHRIGFA